MKLINDNAGRRPIAFQSPSQGVNAEQNVNTQTPIVLDNQGGVVLSGSTSFNDGNGIFLGWCNGIPVFSVGNGSQGVSWDGTTLSIIGNILLGIGNSISAGSTAFGVGVGFWLGTDASGNPQFSLIDQFGNSIIFDSSSSNPISVNSTGVVNVLSSQQIDDGGWTRQALVGNITGLPVNGPITGAAWASSVATFTVASTQYLQAGMKVLIAAVNPAGYNGAYIITGVTPTTFTVALASNPGSYVSGGVYGTYYFLSDYGIVDAQSILPLSTAVRQALFEDNGGMPYFADLYDTNFNLAGDATGKTTTTSATGFATISNPIGIPNPGQAVNIVVDADVHVVDNTGTVTTPAIKIQYSLDSGTTWTDGPTSASTFTALNGSICCIHASLFLTGITSTGDIQFRVQGGQTVATSITFLMLNFIARLFPVSNFYVVSPLAATVPATRAMSCTSTSPATSCTATGTVKCTFAGGVGPFTPSWAKVSGTGAITSGSTSQTCTISDTETTTTGGATHTTTVNCAVTDAQTYATTAGSASAGTATVTIGTHNIPVGATVNVSGCTPSNYNGTALVVTGITATQIKYAVSGSPGIITVQGTVNNVTVTTGNCVMTGTFTLKYPAITATISGGQGSCSTSTCGVNCTANTSCTANPSGGNGSYTYSWTVTGTATIVSGASSKTCNFHDTEPTTSPRTQYGSTPKCSVNDTIPTGAVVVTGSILLTFSCPAN